MAEETNAYHFILRTRTQILVVQLLGETLNATVI